MAATAAMIFKRNKNPYASAAVRRRRARKLAMCSIGEKALKERKASPLPCKDEARTSAAPLR